jgi:tetratricopeptide (TPR) repeat protein
MPLRRRLLVACLPCLGCLAFLVGEACGQPESAGELWEKGQAAMRAGDPGRAIGFYERSLKADPTLTRNHMSLAAAYLESGDDEAACVHLAQYVQAHPEHTVMRREYAELLLRLGRQGAARDELNRLAADVQEAGPERLTEAIQCHSRLLAIAEEQEDDYGVHLHRGVGLYLLARQRSGLDDPDDQLPAEGLLCKCISELTLARLLRPAEARPCWYLYAAWQRLGQRRPALHWLAETIAAGPFDDLTPAERRSLALARRLYETAP